MSEYDIFFDKAINLAEKGLGSTRPNPPVGALLVKDGEIIGSGFHKKAGENHAEVAAIEDAKKNNKTIEGSTLIVTLEPCSTKGRVGACTDAIIKEKISRVFYAMQDPNPKNAGRAKTILNNAGIICEEWPSISVAQRAKINRIISPFVHHQKTNLPFVTVKLALSLDGKICDDSGSARWLSSKESLLKTRNLRHEVDAIMVGAETLRRDNPTLLPYDGENPNLLRVVISSSKNLPKDAKVFTDGKNKTFVFSTPREALEELGKMGCLHVLCEGGLKLARSMAAEGLVNAWRTVLCPLVIGEQPLAAARRFTLETQSLACNCNDVDTYFLFKD